MKKVYLLFLFVSNFTFSQIWVDTQNANYVISAANLNSQGNGNFSPNDSTISNYRSTYAIDAKHKFLYVADHYANRVMRFSYPVIKNQPKATLVYGQTSLFMSLGNTTPTGLIRPMGLAVDSISGTLWIMDGTNNRVLRFDSAHKNTTNGPSASQVLGQGGFYSGNPGTSQTTFSLDVFTPAANLLYYDHATGHLWVGDNMNNRVLLFKNAKSLSDGAPADAVLGQGNFTTITATCTASNFGGQISSITMIGNSVFVCDPYNQRVLRFDNVYSKPNGAPADAVFGQTSFTTNATGCSATQMSGVVGITADQSRLYVTENFNNRICIFNSALTNTVASNVLWAINFSSPGNSGCTPFCGLLCQSIVMDPVYQQLLIEDVQYKRIMVYNAGLSTSIGSNQLQNVNDQFSLYPNPTNGEFNILANSFTKNTSLEIYNTMGQMIKHEPLVDTKTKINLEKEPNGIYFVKVIENGNTVHYSKIIKQ